MVELEDAINARFTAQSLGTTIPGGLHKDLAPEGTAMPYATYSFIGAPRSQSYATAPYTAHVQFGVHGTNSRAAGVLAEALTDAMDLNLTIAGGFCISSLVLMEPIGMRAPEDDKTARDSSGNVVWSWHSEIEYTVQ